MQPIDQINAGTVHLLVHSLSASHPAGCTSGNRKETDHTDETKNQHHIEYGRVSFFLHREPLVRMRLKNAFNENEQTITLEDATEDKRLRGLAF